MKSLLLAVLILLALNCSSQNRNEFDYMLPSIDKLKNIDELNKLAIASNGGALGCGTLIMEKEGKLVYMGASLDFLLNEERIFDIELMHAICYARYANVILNDTSWPLPNSSLCFTASEVLVVFHNEDSPYFLCMLAEDENRRRIALHAMAEMVENNPKMRKKIKKCIRNYNLPVNYEVPKWMQKQMIQPSKNKEKTHDNS